VRVYHELMINVTLKVTSLIYLASWYSYGREPKARKHSTEKNHKVVDITYAIEDIGYVVQCPRFMDIEALQNKVTVETLEVRV